nr:hypothetical protein TorRG33x02_296220 [Ipomoea trifida]
MFLWRILPSVSTSVFNSLSRVNPSCFPFRLRSFFTAMASPLLSPGLPENPSKTPPFMNATGIAPESILFEKFIGFGSNSPRLSGILPIKRLLDKSRRPISNGIGPDRRLLLASSFTRLVTLEITQGRVPEIILPWMNTLVAAFRRIDFLISPTPPEKMKFRNSPGFPRTGNWCIRTRFLAWWSLPGRPGIGPRGSPGILPIIPLSLNSRSTKDSILPIPTGISPESLHAVNTKLFSFLSPEIFAGSRHGLKPPFSLKLSTSRLLRLVTDKGNSPVKRLKDKSSDLKACKGFKSGKTPVKYPPVMFSSSKAEQLVIPTGNRFPWK